MYDSKAAWLKGTDQTVQQFPDLAADVIFLLKRGRELTDEELAEVYGISVEEYRESMGKNVMEIFCQ